jgi:CSLREA domain-containing protein
MIRQLAFITILGLAAPASAQTGRLLTVTSAGDGADTSPGNGVCTVSGGGCTLRAAIQEANAFAGADTINFAIGSGPQTITLGANLPAISQSVVIDGWTQPGFSGSPLIFVNGNNKSGPGVLVTGSNVTVRGLVVGNFRGDGVELRGAGGNVLEGNYVGMSLDGVAPAANSGHGIVVSSAPNNRIGGPAKVQRNLISNNTAKGNGGGIILNGAGGNVIQGNFIGTDITGMVERANEARGIAIIGSSNNLIGGPDAGMGNLIAGNRATGVRMLGGSSNNTVQGNIIGLNKLMTEAIANDRGVQIRDGDSNKVIGNMIAGNTYDGVLVWGGTNSLIYGNTIAYNGYGPVGDPQEQGWFGVWIATGTGNTVLSNSIFSNYLTAINLNTDIISNANDAGDGDGGPNEMQNYPLIASATRTATTTAITGTLNSTPNTSFRVQVFANPSCDYGGVGEAQYLISDTVVATNAAGNASLALNIAAAVPLGWIVSANATNATTGNTSEMSQCVVVK